MLREKTQLLFFVAVQSLRVLPVSECVAVYVWTEKHFGLTP